MDLDFLNSAQRIWIGFDTVVLNFFATFSSVPEL